MPKNYSLHGKMLKTNYLDLPYNPELKPRASTLRKAGNFPEVAFWLQVNKRQFHGLDFDRQRIIGNYIVDFYVKSLGLVIEIDGDSHEGREEQDNERENWLQQQGCRVIRFPARMVTNAMPHILEHIESFILEHYT
jgi:very-short-patch-repair endonuclease